MRIRSLFLLPLLFTTVLAAAGCEKLFPPPERPATHGWRGRLVGRSNGKPVELEVAWKKGLGRRMQGNEGARRGVILRPDRGEAIELDEVTKSAKVRPMAPGEPLWDANGPYPFEPVPLAKFDFRAYQKRFPPELQVTRQALADSLVGPHPCDVVRFDRESHEGRGAGEVWYFARDLDGLVVRREVKPIEGNRYLDEVEIDELAEVKVGAPDDLFEIPKGWSVVRVAAPATPMSGSAAAPPAAPEGGILIAR